MALPASSASADAARSKAFDTGRAEGRKTGATAERTRIATILRSDAAKARPVAAFAAAFETDMTAEQAIKFLARVGEEKPKGKNPFLAAMDASQDFDLGAPGEHVEVPRHQRALALSGKSIIPPASAAAEPGNAMLKRAGQYLSAGMPNVGRDLL